MKRDSRPRWDRLYDRHFPHNTDPASRHVKTIAQALRRKDSALHILLAGGVGGWETDHMAASMESTVVALWKARAEIRKLREKLTNKPVNRRRKSAVKR